MMRGTSAVNTEGGASRGDRRWSSLLRPYCEPRTGRGFVEIAATLLPLALFWGLLVWSVETERWWLYALLLVPAGLFLVRVFLLQHDCGHYAFFSAKAVNDWFGRALGVLTLTPYDHWRRCHAIHHASCGNLDRRGVGDIDTLTVEEYRALSPWGRLVYRAYRHPLVLFGIGPSFVFMLQNRIPTGRLTRGIMPWISTQSTNLGIAALAALAIWGLGLGTFLLVHLPVVVVAATIGVWLFYVQHQFETTSWDHADTWNLQDAALHGSSYYRLPPGLRWLTADIGIHHVHHLASRIPFYRLSEVLKDHPELRDIGGLTLLRSFACVRLTLWDERTRRLVSFRDALGVTAGPA